MLGEANFGELRECELRRNPIRSSSATEPPSPLGPPCTVLRLPRGGPGREEVDSQTGADDHGRLGHQPLTSRLPSSNRTSKLSTGSLAGPRSTSPLSTSNSEPWHGQITVLSCRSPSASEHPWWVQVSSKA